MLHPQKIKLVNTNKTSGVYRSFLCVSIYKLFVRIYKLILDFFNYEPDSLFKYGVDKIGFNKRSLFDLYLHERDNKVSADCL